MARDVHLLRSFADLLHVLAQDGVPHQTDAEEKTVRIPTQRGDLDSVLLLRWQDGDGVIQFIQALPLSVPHEQVAVVCDALARLNHAMAIPGLDLNHTHRVLAYRLYLPLYPRGEVAAGEVQAMFRLAVKSASDMLPVLTQLLSGQVAPSGIVAAAQEHLAHVAQIEQAQLAELAKQEEEAERARQAEEAERAKQAEDVERAKQAERSALAALTAPPKPAAPPPKLPGDDMY